MFFQRVPEPKTVKNRVHLDVGASGGRGVDRDERIRRVQGEADRLTSVGAAHVQEFDRPDRDEYWIVMTDPEGNEFCVH